MRSYPIEIARHLTGQDYLFPARLVLGLPLGTEQDGTRVQYRAPAAAPSWDLG